MAARKQSLFGHIDDNGRLIFDEPVAFARVGVVIPIISEWSGFTPEETHLALKEHFLSEFDRQHGLMRMKSTADLSTVDFEKYMSNIRMWAADQGQFIPLPNEEYY